MKKRVFTIVLCLSLILGTVAYAAVDFTSFKMTFSNTNTYQKITSDRIFLFQGAAERKKSANRR